MSRREDMIISHERIITGQLPEIESAHPLVQSTDRSCQPLDEVDLDPPARAKRHLRLVTATAADEEDDPDGCSPWSCRSGTAVAGNDTEERAA